MSDSPAITYTVDNIIFPPCSTFTPTIEFLSNKILIRYLPGAAKLEKTDVGDWVDLYTYEENVLHKGDFKILNLGVAMKLPEGYEAHIAPRSSTFKRWGVIQTNGVGVVDNTYCSNTDIWGMPVYATRDVTIPKDTRLCQFRLMPVQTPPTFSEVDDLNSKPRGGFGSTGA